MTRAEAGGQRLYGLNRAAEAQGLYRGQLLADARAIAPTLRTDLANPEADAAALRQWGQWAMRYTPWIGVRLAEDGTAVFYLDIEGCEHLFGSEAQLVQDLQTRLARNGVQPRAAVADTIGAAHALAHYAVGDHPFFLPAGTERAGLAPLTVRALRIGQTAEALERAGLKKIGDLFRIARPALTARFGVDLLIRLDQALGTLPEPLNPLKEPLSHRVKLVFVEPISQIPHIEIAIARATQDLGAALAQKGLGARRLRLTLHRADGALIPIEVGTSAPVAETGHLARLFKERLKATGDELEMGEGIEVLTLEAAAEPLTPCQAALASGPDHSLPSHDGELNLLIDRLGARLTLARIERLDAQASHIPERAVVARPAAQGHARHWDDAPDLGERPLLMLPAAEPAEVIAGLPDGPPLKFRWRRNLIVVAHAEGPERITPEWWRPGLLRDDGRQTRTRDYFRVEDNEGRRFWLYRDGLYGDAAIAPKWYVHGVFA